MSWQFKTLVLGLVPTLAGVTLAGVTMISLDMAFEKKDLWGERERGLRWLFKVRGSRQAPSDVVVVTTDRAAAYALGQKQEIWKWPRSFHGKLVRNLVEQGATVIAFDIYFKEAHPPEEDQVFAEAIREAGNVVLFEKMTKYGETTYALTPPTPSLAEAATALAPHPLPAIPFRVDQFWLFEPSGIRGATLPFIAYQIHVLARYPELRGLLKRAAPEIAHLLPARGDIHPEFGQLQTWVKKLREKFKPPQKAWSVLAELDGEASGVESDLKKVRASLVKAYNHGDSRYLDFYGPPRTITTVPYSCVLERCPPERGAQSTGPRESFSGKAVFVGFSEQVASEQKDRIHTVFTQDTGVDLSGVEIAATAFANLLEDRQISPLEWWHRVLLVAGWGMILSFAFHKIPPSSPHWTGFMKFIVATLATGSILGAAYLVMAYSLFAWEGLWIPLVVPLFVQLPLGLFGTLVWRYWETHKERQNIQKALEHYIPGPVAHQLTKSIEDIKTTSQVVEGICLATDAEHYTGLAESLEVEELRTFMNDYYETLFEPVRRRDGIVSDVVGDAVLAIWAAPDLDRELRKQVCESALDIVTAVGRFNRLHPETPLPTRIGLHGGRMLLGNIGAMDHYEYRAVGDIVNTATRIEGLNKYLRTRTLASHRILDGLGGFFTRDLGRFRLAGKTQPISIYELICHEEEADGRQREAIRVFAEGLEAFRDQRWEEAQAIFRRVLDIFEIDGPSQYYVEACEKFKAEPPQFQWEGVVILSQK